MQDINSRSHVLDMGSETFERVRLEEEFGRSHGDGCDIRAHDCHDLAEVDQEAEIQDKI